MDLRQAQVRHWVGNGVPKLVERALTGELEGTVNKDDYDKAYPIFLDLYTKNTSGRSSLYHAKEFCSMKEWQWVWFFLG
jgi:phosphoglycolate phosphatase